MQARSVLALGVLGVSLHFLCAETILIDFGNDESWRGVSVSNPAPTGDYWNSVRPGQYVSGLLNDAGVATGVAFGPGAHPTDSYNGPAGATVDPVAAVDVERTDIDEAALGQLGVKAAAFDFIVGKLGDASGRFQLQGLDSSQVYTLTFFASHKYNVSSSGEGTNFTRINVYSDPDHLNLLSGLEIEAGVGSSHNRDTVARMVDISPSANGIFYIEFGGADGVDSGYLNSMSVSTEGSTGGAFEPPNPEPSVGIKLVVAGSSVPAGAGALDAGSWYHDFDADEDDTRWGGWEDDYAIYGYTGRLRLSLTAPENPRFPGGSTTSWEFVNVSVPGNNTSLLRERFMTDVRRQYTAPKPSYSEPDYVLIALSMANEGLVYSSTPGSVVESFRTGMLDLIQSCRDFGYTPIITLVYPHNDYGEEQYELVKAMNIEMNSWGVPAINLLGAIDNGFGQWADGFSWDAGHPNYLGHQEMYYAIPPTLFAAMELDGKKAVPSYPLETGNLEFWPHDQILFEPEDPMHAFTSSFRFKGTVGGVIATIEDHRDVLALVDFGAAELTGSDVQPFEDIYGRVWNVWQPVEPGLPVEADMIGSNVLTVGGESSGLSLRIIREFSGSGQYDTRSNPEVPTEGVIGSFAVESAVEDYFSTDSSGVLEISGLDTDQRYTFRLFGSAPGTTDQQTRFRVTGDMSEVNYAPVADILTTGSGVGGGANMSAIALFTDIKPRADGTVFITVEPLGTAGTAVINALEILHHGDVREARLEVTESGLIYGAPDGQTLSVAGTFLDGTWHSVALSHRYAQQQTLLYINGVESGMVRETLLPARFSLGSSGPQADGFEGQIEDWALLRAAWTEVEASAQAQGLLQHASLDVFCPLNETRAELFEGAFLENTAISRSSVSWHTFETASASFWNESPLEPTSGARWTNLGWLQDELWPFVYFYGNGEWVYIIESASLGAASFFGYALQAAGWIWSSDAYGGWFYNYASQEWGNFKE